MGDDSLVGIVDLMTGEKDPRNLMLVFSILKVVMVEWDISNHTEVLVPISYALSDAKYNSFFLTRYIITSRLRSGRRPTIPMVSPHRT